MKYVSLHNHTSHSVFDAIGTAQQFYNQVIETGGDAMAITEHGSCNSLGYAVTAYNALAKKGVNFRAIYGVEAYVIPSLSDWHKLYNKEDTENDLVVEDEQESKSKHYDPIKRRHHLVITALNNKGLQNLFTLVSLSYRRENFYRFPRMDFEMLRKYNDGLAISSSCLAGIPTFCSLQNPEATDAEVLDLYDKELLPLLEIFGKDRAFLELQFNALAPQRIVNNHLIQYAERTGYKLIVASDAHYCRPDLWRERELYKSLGRQMKGGGVDISAIPTSIENLECELYPHNADQIYGAYEKYFQDDIGKYDQVVKDAINRTHDIAWHLMDQVTPDSSIKLPKFVPVSAKSKTPFDELKNICIEELRRKGLDKKKEYIERTIYELKIIKDKNVAEYFITKKAILDALRKDLLLGVGRGSGAGSIVNYLLGITLADPVKGGLLFERFISPSRAELPDIDSDCEDKDQAFALLQKRFGEDNVLAISNYNTLKLKSLVKDVAKLYSVPYEEVNEVTKVMESEAKEAILEEVGQDQKLYELTYERCYKYSLTFQSFIDQYPQVGECLSVLYKSIKSIGRHAGGVLIIEDAYKHLPIIRVRNVLQSPFTEGLTAQHLKLFGLIKFDVLGLTTLKIIRRCIEFILKKQGNEAPNIDDVWKFYNENLHPDVIDPADSNVFKNVYHEGRFPSIFQFAEIGVKKFVQRAKPENVTDLAVCTSLWRPGSLSSKGDEIYLQGKNEGVHYDHPILEDILKETYGVVIFQESFMQLANKLANFSLDEADKLRKLLSKPSHELGQEMREQRIRVGQQFIDGCIAKGLKKQRAHDLWHKEILPHCSYSFNKSHALVYAYNSYHCAFLYTYYETEWIKACLECDPDLGRTISTVTQLGYTVCKPDINESLADEWQINDKRCIPPFTAIKNIGSTAADELVKLRGNGFSSLEDFFWITENGIQKWRWSKFNKKSLEALIQLEAFESINEKNNFQNYSHMHRVVFDSFDKIKKGINRYGRGKKAVVENLRLEELPGYNDCIPDWQSAEKILHQKELTGTFDKNLLFSPESLSLINKYQIEPFSETNEQTYKLVWFFVNSISKQITKRGNPYLRLLISDGQNEPKTINYFNEELNVKMHKLYAAQMIKDNAWFNIKGKLYLLN